MSKKNLENLEQTHGKEEKKFQPTTLQQVWGDTGISKYNTLDLTEYTNFLANLNMSDLQAHAAKLGIIPTASRDSLSKRLIKEFRVHVAGFQRPTDQRKIPTPPSKSALSILAEGK